MDDLVALSRRLSYVLRHHPDSIGLELDAAAWVDVATLLAALADDGVQVTHSDLDSLATGSDTQRFELREERIRARYGHSVDVDLELVAQSPPAELYHGTVARFLSAITEQGLRSRSRSHVHLSETVQQARRVGRRRGKPIMLVVDAGAMAADGHEFWHATDGVWLTDLVPAAYLRGGR